jgi:glutaconate CoA-transferase, subunit A
LPLTIEAVMRPTSPDWRVLAARRSLVTVEQIVDELEPRPGAVVIPAWVIDFVAEAPRGSYPSYSLGLTQRDNDCYRHWDQVSRDRNGFRAWMNANVLTDGARP